MTGPTGADVPTARSADTGGARLGARHYKTRGEASRAFYDVLAIGPRLPFMVGQSVATDALLGHLQRGGVRVKALDIAPRIRRPKWAQRLSRIPRYARALLALGAGHKAAWVYISVDAGAGVYPNILCAMLARLRGSRVIAHHHNYSYIAQPARRIRVFCKAAGPDAMHITLCALMSRELRQGYRGVSHTLELSNTHTLGDVGPKTSLPERFTLGHLSNLCIEKGLIEVVNCLRLLRQAGVDAMLRLAGPPANREAAAIIKAARAEFPGAFVYEGPLYGMAKQEFYRGISVFLLPTKYRAEAQPIVNLEALAAGTPVIAYGRGCIPHDLSDLGGLVVPTSVSFEESALPWLLEWARDRAALERASSLARCRFKKLQREGEEHLQSLFAVLNLDG